MEVFILFSGMGLGFLLSSVIDLVLDLSKFIKSKMKKEKKADD